MAQGIKDKLIDALLENQLLSREQLDKALEVQKLKGGKLSSTLISMGFVNERDLIAAIGKSLNVPPINLTRFRIDPDVIKLVPEKVARHYQLIPVSKIGGTLTVAMSDPLNVFAIDDIKTLTNYEIRPVVSSENQIQEAINSYYGGAASELIDTIIKDRDTNLNKSGSGLELLEEKDEGDKFDSGEILKLVVEGPVVKVTNALLSEAIKRKASDVLIESMERKMRVRYRVDGMLQEGEAPPKTMGDAIVSRIKVIAQLDIAERRLPQDGRFKIKFSNPDREVDFRVSVIPSSYGEKIALRVLDKSSVILDVDKLGFEGKSLDDLKACAARPYGMIIICGPTGCGKTTSLYSVLKLVDKLEINIVTVEDPIEYQLEGVNQVAALPDIGLTFAAALRSILRQDPDVIMIGEIRDFETVDIAIKSALTGHLVLSTLHTTDAAGSITRLTNMGVEPFLITASCLMIGAQRLVRVLCQFCKEPYEPSEALLSSINIKEPKKGMTFYKPKGCNKCGAFGYRGRIGIIETLMLTDNIKDLILKKAPESDIKAQARREGMVTLREDGLKKVMAGVISLEEVLRVTAPDADIRGAQ